MPEPTLVSVFGANATQTATTITFTKADLIGLTSSANNSAESLLVAILLTAQANLTQTNFDGNIDQSIVIEKGLSSFTTRGSNNDPYRVDELNVSLSKIDVGATLDPDNY